MNKTSEETHVYGFHGWVPIRIIPSKLNIFWNNEVVISEINEHDLTENLN